MARLMPLALAISGARSIAALVPEITTWPGALSLATTQTPPVARAHSFATRFGLFDLGADQRAHAALAHRHRRLHRLAARLEQPRRVGQREGAGSASAEYSPSE